MGSKNGVMINAEDFKIWEGFEKSCPFGTFLGWLWTSCLDAFGKRFLNIFCFWIPHFEPKTSSAHFSEVLGSHASLHSLGTQCCWKWELGFIYSTQHVCLKNMTVTSVILWGGFYLLVRDLYLLARSRSFCNMDTVRAELALFICTWATARQQGFFRPFTSAWTICAKQDVVCLLEWDAESCLWSSPSEEGSYAQTDQEPGESAVGERAASSSSFAETLLRKIKVLWAQSRKETERSCIAESSVTKHCVVWDKIQFPNTIGESIKADFTFVEVVGLPFLSSSENCCGWNAGERSVEDRPALAL